VTPDPRQAQQTAFAAGDLVAERFRIVRLLGRGGMGEVYEAEDLVLHREHVALKTLPALTAAEERAIERLKREIALARRVTHPNVCRVFDVDQHRTSSGEPVTFFTMELLRGDTLAARLRQHGPLTATDALPLIRQMAAGLGAAHAVGIVHGDFKTGNVMLVPPAEKGGPERLVVTDFSLAHPAQMGATSDPTMTASPGWGTPAYMAPEQIAAGQITRQTDVYAMGAVVHEMITGRLPFGSHPPPGAALDPRWRSAVHKCLERDPAARFNSAEQFVRALEAPDSEPLPKKRWMVAGLVAAAVAAAVALGLSLSSSLRTAVISRVPALAGAFAPARRSVAFLPFTDAQPDPDSQAFGEGLAIVLTEQLRLASRLQQFDDRLWVLPAAEVIDAGLRTPAGARRRLGVNLIVGGHVARDERRTTLTLDLEDASGEKTTTQGHDAFQASDGGSALVPATMIRLAGLIGMSLTPATARSLAVGWTSLPAAEELYLRGRGYLAHREAMIDPAVDALQRAITIDPEYALAHAALGEAYRQKYLATLDPAFIPRAQASSDRAIALAPSVAYARVVRGLVYASTGQHARGIRELQAALEADPGAVEPRRGLAEAFEEEGAPDKAEEIYRQQVALYPEYWNAHEQLGSYLFRHGRYGEAETSFLNGLQYAPDNARAISNLAALYALTDRYAAAEAELQRGLKLAPDVLTLNNLSFIYVFQGRFAEAVPPMESAVRLPGANSFHWGNLARVYRWANRADQARATYEMAIDLARREISVNPRNALIRANMARLLAETGHPGEALAEMSSTLERASTNMTVVFASALVHELTGNRAAALRALETAARGGHSVAEIRRHPDLTRLREDPRYLKILDLVPKVALQ
jgi:tetratricopeptide (TPR) repeat protein/TolB-like protein